MLQYNSSDKNHINIDKIMKDINIEAFSISKLGSVKGLEEVYEYRKLGGSLTGLEPQGEFRAAPDKFMKAGKSIIAIAIPYETYNSFLEKNFCLNNPIRSNIRGFISNMAWEFDYHKVVHQKLEQIKSAILEHYDGAKFLTAVDTADINDRMTAYGARLGWIGRNQFLINAKHGTSFYIGILITDIELPNRVPWRDDYEMKCYSCRQCQMACPVNALTGEQDFHGQRCISTLTQLKRDLTYEECISIGTNIYGCDICQWVCPYNEKAINVQDEFKRHSKNILEPREILEFTNKKFKKKYANSGFAWRGLSVFKRNALICMGNDGRIEDWEYIFEHLNYYAEKLWRYAIWAMCRIDMDRTLLCKDDIIAKISHAGKVYFQNEVVNIHEIYTTIEYLFDDVCMNVSKSM